MAALLCLPEVVLVAVCSEWNASLGQVEFQGARSVRNDRGTALRRLALM